MDLAERYVRSWIASSNDDELQKTVQSLSNDEIKLLDIVKALGEYLTSEEDYLRSKGVDFLSSILERCPESQFNRQSARVLVSFYCSKLDDTETITPALKGLVPLSKLPLLTSAEVEQIVSAVFQHVKMRALVQSERFHVFTVFHILLEGHRETLKSLGLSFLQGYIALAEGEKDPRNLLLAFKIDKVLLENFDVGPILDDFFNVTFCYFPITFRPPPNDPYGITSEHLKDSLTACLNATPAFALLGIPLFLDKLNAGSPATKKDTLQTMSKCIPVYGTRIGAENARKIWTTLKLEIFQPIDETLQELSLETLQVLIGTLQAGEPGEDGINPLTKTICSECVNSLREPEKAPAQGSIKVICSLLSISRLVASHVTSQAVTTLVEVFHTPDEISSRPATSTLLSELIAQTHIRWSKLTADSTSEEAESPLIPLKEDLLGVARISIQDQAIRKTALTMLESLVLTPRLLSTEELRVIIQKVTEFISPDFVDDDETRNATIVLLSAIASTGRSPLLAELSLPVLFEALPDRAPAVSASEKRMRYWRSLASLGKLCLASDLFEIFIIRLTTKLDLICQPDYLSSHREPTAAYTHAILTTIASALSSKVDQRHTDLPKYADRLLPPLYKLFIVSSITGEESIASDTRLIEECARVISLMSEALPVDGQQRLSSALCDAYLSGSTLDLIGVPVPDSRFQPFSKDANAAQRNTVALFSATLVTLDKKVSLATAGVESLLNTILTWGLSSSNHLQERTTYRLSAAVTNKRTSDAAPFLKSFLEGPWSSRLTNSDVLLSERKYLVQLWAWITKALLVQNHMLTPRFSDGLISLLRDKHIGEDTGKAFGILCSKDDLLTKRNHAVIRILAVQRYFDSVLPQLIEEANVDGTESTSWPHLVAITSLIHSVPRAMYFTKLSSLITLLIRTLESPDSKIRSMVIEILLINLKEPSEDHPMSSYASTITSAMLKNCTASEVSSPNVRIAALKVLGVLPDAVRYDVLHPYKAQTIKELGKAVDDPKRAVREEAVLARTKWFTMNK